MKRADAEQAIHERTIAIADNHAPVTITGLAKRYGTRDVFRDVSLRLEPGQVLGLLGRNGAGKSTLIRCMLGLEAPDAGTCSLFGAPSQRLPDRVKMRVAYVPQRTEAFLWLDVVEFFTLMSRFYPRWDGNYVQAALAEQGFNPYDRLRNLSPGQRQQLFIIRALAAKPDLLVLDEPAASLDPVARRALMREVVSRAGEQECAVLLSTHIVSDLERVASHVALLHAGGLLLHDEIDVIKEECARAHLPVGIEASDLEHIPGLIAKRRTTNGWTVVFRRGSRDAWPEALHAQAGNGEALGLEDLFIEVTA